MVYHAQRSYYEALLRSGVKIWMYKRPFILHSKSMSVMILDGAQLRDELLAAHEQRDLEVETEAAHVHVAQRSYYEALLRSGVKIWMYKRPFILHSKSMSIDDEVVDHRLIALFRDEQLDVHATLTRRLDRQQQPLVGHEVRRGREDLDVQAAVHPALQVDVDR
jgi:hypothetical protein